ncbi:hypothetical protein BD410DRAFT_901363 [Rickenella mellea]|uniref:Uncharacterized protein n=1 Tax=Rickenella mellea TaxID=50990 RepID=A0A4Y7PRA3_9AGAM|nr:hypothetical protein BD410DRAFT_901363 [Rickenella mellea]
MVRSNPLLGASSTSITPAQDINHTQLMFQLSQLSPEQLQGLITMAAIRGGTHQPPPPVPQEPNTQLQHSMIPEGNRNVLTSGQARGTRFSGFEVDLRLISEAHIVSSVAPPGTSLNAPTSRREPPIDPSLLETSEISLVMAEVKGLRAELEELKRARHSASDDDGDADDENDGRQRKRKRTKRRSLRSEHILSVKTDRLNREQKETRNELHGMVKREMEELTGITKKEALPGPTTPVPAHTDETNSDHRQLMHSKLDRDVTDAKNKAIIMRAAELVFKEQTDGDLRKLKHKDVKFTEADLRSFATAVLRSWKRRFEAENNGEKGRKAKLQAQKNKRHQRQRTLKAARLAVAELYAEIHDGADPSCLLETDWMTEEVSSLDTSDDEEKEAHRQKMVQAARLTEKEIECGTVVLEKIKPLFRSDEVDGIYEELDQLGRKKQKESGKTYARKPRADLGRTRVQPPAVSLYPFMVRESWFEDHIAGTSLEDNFEVLPEDPEGFGSNP